MAKAAIPAAIVLIRGTRTQAEIPLLRNLFKSRIAGN
jgi:hypothetical protein